MSTSFFSAIASLLDTGVKAATVICSRQGRDLSVIVSPQGDGALSSPVVLKGTPEELDAEFGALLECFSLERISLASQLSASVESMNEAAKEPHEANPPGKSVVKTSSIRAAKTGHHSSQEEQHCQDSPDAMQGVPNLENLFG